VGEQRRADLADQRRVFGLEQAGRQVLLQPAGEGERPQAGA